ncbi:hypothetical protein A4R35_00825 [Thermogemmatispora tikiterensis]|uniref:PPM-type phosphatase domain-containing protein n=2 Tax=Thermogemmatispora tikiterensis TaxID=1825093 RepID=A0A328VIE5_9CHLR|nr:hypothetical protein A4R35_00825 [Thermogemmatispora tikiterensis]
MPFGMMPGMQYEERAVTLECGDNVLFYSDGLVEAHHTRRERFGFPHPMALLQEHPGDPGLIEHVLNELARLSGSGWEQEDDVTLRRADATQAQQGQESVTVNVERL